MQEKILIYILNHGRGGLSYDWEKLFNFKYFTQDIIFKSNTLEIPFICSCQIKLQSTKK